MNKYRFTLRQELVTFVDIEADDEQEAFENLRGYIDDGGTGDHGYWNTIDWDEPPELICPHCNCDSAGWLGLPCCNKGKSLE